MTVFFPVENCSVTGAKNKKKRDTLVFRCSLLGFLAPERGIFIVVADGTCRRRRKKSQWLKINYSPAQHARTKNNNKNKKKKTTTTPAAESDTKKE